MSGRNPASGHQVDTRTTATRRRHAIVATLILSLAVGLIVFDVFASERNRAWQFEPIDGAVEFAGLVSSETEEPIIYDRRPPPGGPHAPITQACGIYRVPVSDTHAVASLATGAVWIAYRPDLPPAEVEALYDWAIGKRDLILAPYPDLPAPLVLTAWGVQLSITSAADERIVPFFQQYKNADSAPARDDHCVDGLGIPVP